MLKTLKDFRRSRHLKQADIAKILGIPQQHYSLIERGLKRLQLQHLYTLCNHFATTPQQIGFEVALQATVRPLPEDGLE